MAKIGDPDRTLSYGAHVFEIRYTIPGVLDPGTTGAGKQFAATTGDPTAAPTVFFWNVIAPSWNNHIRAVDVSVELPANVTGAQCSVGSGVGVICDDLTIRGNRVELSAANLAPRTPVTVRAGEWQQVQLVRAGSSYASHSERTLTFGLGAGKLIDAVEIAWPDGERQRLEGTALADAVDHELFIRRSGIEARRSLEPTVLAPVSGVR